jgi:hypothetical protein
VPEPQDFLQVRSAQLGDQQGEDPAGLDRAELAGVAHRVQPGPGVPGGLLDQREIGGGCLRGLIQYQHVIGVDLHRVAQSVGVRNLPEELGDVVRLGQPLILQHVGRVGAGRQADYPGAFKIRGALNKILSLGGCAGGVVGWGRRLRRRIAASNSSDRS